MFSGSGVIRWFIPPQKRVSCCRNFGLSKSRLSGVHLKIELANAEQAAYRSCIRYDNHHLVIDSNVLRSSW
jgi:hypothetical protein